MNVAASASTRSSAPEITTAFGPLTAAMPTPSPSAVSAARTSVSVASIAAIAPGARSACINRPRAATTAHASGSDHRPAQYAAASSPIECPASTSGVSPQERTRAKSATS